MKPLAKCLILFMLATMLASAGMHKYYVAVFQVEHNPQKKKLQMTSRIFIDDLEAAFEKKYGRKFYLGDKRELPDAGEYIGKYISEKVRIKVNGKAKIIKYLGKEIENDVLVCYCTIPVDGKISTLEMENSVLFEMFPEQQNILNTKINGNKKSLLLTNDEPDGLLEF